MEHDQVSNPSYSAAHVLQEVARLEQALAAASKGLSNHVASGRPATIQVEPDPLPTHETTSDPAPVLLDRANLATNRDGDVARMIQPLGPVARPPQAVARLEDVLTIGPRVDEKQIVPAPVGQDRIAPEPAPAPVPETQPAPTDAQDTAAALSDQLERAKRQAARLEQLLTEARVAARLAAAAVPGVEPAQTEAQDADVDAAPIEAIEPPAPTGDPALPEVISQAPPPTAVAAVDAEPGAPADSSESVARGWMAQVSGRHWFAVVCLLALLGLVVVLTGRDPRRSVGASPH